MAFCWPTCHRPSDVGSRRQASAWRHLTGRGVSRDRVSSVAIVGGGAAPGRPTPAAAATAAGLL